MQRILIFFISLCVVWFIGVKPFISELSFFRFTQTGNKTYLLKSLKQDPLNSHHNMVACEYYVAQNQFVLASEFADMAIRFHNGDLVPWAVYYAKGIISLQTNNVHQAKYDLEMALRYNPNFVMAENLLNELGRIS